jgi:hypothetical protein
LPKDHFAAALEVIMELKRLDGFVALMPFTRAGNLGWDWLGASLAQALGERLIFAGLTVLPYYALGNIREFDGEILTDCQEQILLGEFLTGGHIIAGSYALDEKRFALSLYAMSPTGISLLAKEEDTAENWLTPLLRQSQRVVSAFGPVDAEIRGQMDAIVSTRNLAALQALSAAHTSWAVRDMEAVRASVERARTLDGEFLDPLTVLVQATHDLGDPHGLRMVRKAQLAQLISSSAFKSLTVAGEMLAHARWNNDHEWEAECLKAEQAIAGRLGTRDPGRIYAARFAKLNLQYEEWLGESKRSRKATAGLRWSAGQRASLCLAARSWLRQAEGTLQVGYSAARLYAMRAQGVFALLGSAEREDAKKVVSQAVVELRPRSGK